MLLVKPTSRSATVEEHFPSAHLLQTEAEAAEYCPVAQEMQVLASEAPTVGEYLPTPHSWHVLNPAVVEYFPGAQSVQVLWPSLEYVPAAQAVHVTAPDDEPQAQSLEYPGNASFVHSEFLVEK
jgi:hypothetical protein